jgi:hypothetical protein
MSCGGDLFFGGNTRLFDCVVVLEADGGGGGGGGV